VSEDRRPDEALEDFLRRRSGVSRAYRDASAEQPPAALDAAILAASRRAVGAGPRRIGWVRRWGSPLAAAAVLVLAVAVVLNLQDEPEIARLKEAEAPAAAPVSPAAEAQVQRYASSSAPPAEAKAEPRSGEADRLADISLKPEPPASAPLGKTAEPVPAPAAPAPRFDEALADRADADPAAAAEAPSQETAAGGVQAMIEVAPSPARKRSEEAIAAQAGRETSAAVSVSPETVLKTIEALYAQGSTEEADRALRGFCRGYPGHALPDSLQRHARQLTPECAEKP
jgi:hypothetical protein